MRATNWFKRGTTSTVGREIVVTAGVSSIHNHCQLRLHDDNSNLLNINMTWQEWRDLIDQMDTAIKTAIEGNQD